MSYQAVVRDVNGKEVHRDPHRLLRRTAERDARAHRPAPRIAGYPPMWTVTVERLERRSERG